MRTRTKVITLSVLLAVATAASITTAVFGNLGFNVKDWAISGREIPWKHHLAEDNVEVDAGKYGTFFVPMKLVTFMPSDESRVTLFWVEYDTKFFTEHRKSPKRLIITFAAVAEEAK